MDEFPPLPVAAGASQLCIDAFLAALHGSPGCGPPTSANLAEFNPRLPAFDVRSPSEFALGHIPGALNLPLFGDEERAVVGTTYKKKGRFAAILTGLGFVGPKFVSLIQRLEELNIVPGDRVLVYCWRGGMRSGSVGWLLSLCGFQVHTLEGGYRSYRRWCKSVVAEDHLSQPAPIMVLGGCTGSGKTAVLQELAKHGEQVLDLEGLANHRGSAFGSMGLPDQPSNEAYENVLALAIRQADRCRRLWLEHEGRHIGRCNVPRAICKWVLTAPGGAFVVMEMSKELRVKRLVEDYCNEESLMAEDWVEKLKECVSLGLAKKLGGQRVKDALKLLDEGHWDQVAGMMIEYYDKLYKKWEAESQSSNVLRVDCPTSDAQRNAEVILQALRRLAEGEGDSQCSSAGAVPATQERPHEPEVEAAGCIELDNALATGENNELKFQGACHCGEVRVTATGEPRSVSYCHCSICRRLSGAPFSCQALYPAEQVELHLEVPGAQIQSLQTSRGVERSRCASCLAPVRASIFGGKLNTVPLGLIATWKQHTNGKDNPMKPRHHLYYKDRVMDVCDGLPKYAGAPSAGKPSRKGGGDEVLLPEVDS
mmetsp:Transcript_5854/g.11259  ORF Transcript_5854/g.11259 Transcript_5854/m.11259 type:complete len:595 (+) Transcript_5854:81-1865(+)